MVSNLRQKGSDKAPGPYCTGLQKHKYQSEYIQDLALTSSGKVVEELSREEYCAAYLVRLMNYFTCCSLDLKQLILIWLSLESNHRQL